MGLLVLVVLGMAWSVWPRADSDLVAQHAAGGAQRSAVVPSTSPGAPVPDRAQASGMASGQMQPDAGASAAAISSSERRKRLSAVRAELSAIMAKGSQASPAQVQKLLDELEVLSQGSFDPRYFQALRDLLEGTGKVQDLNRELQGLTSSTAPKDVARREAILVELRVLSERIGVAATKLQTYSRKPEAQGKAP
ncbi:MAG: hypothetical protein Q8N13_01020 [Acidovorax sp.]|nr:hypothetical protein [Acidovorax sp.]